MSNVSWAKCLERPPPVSKVGSGSERPRGQCRLWDASVVPRGQGCLELGDCRRLCLAAAEILSQVSSYDAPSKLVCLFILASKPAFEFSAPAFAQASLAVSSANIIATSYELKGCGTVSPAVFCGSMNSLHHYAAKIQINKVEMLCHLLNVLKLGVAAPQLSYWKKRWNIQPQSHLLRRLESRGLQDPSQKKAAMEIGLSYGVSYGLSAVFQCWLISTLTGHFQMRVPIV